MDQVSRDFLARPLISMVALVCGVWGCSTTKSIDVTKASMTERNGAYINYAVAKSMFTIQISAATSAAAPSGDKPADKSPAADQKAAAVVPALPDPANQAAAPLPAPAPAPTPAPAPAPPATPSGRSSADAATASADTGVCTALTAEYSAAQTAVGGAISNFALLSTRLARFVAANPAPRDTPKQLAADVRAYGSLVESEQFQLMVSLNQGSSVFGGSPGIYDQIIKNCQPRLAVDAQQKIVPDSSRSFALRPRTNVFYSDTLTFGVDANGFLTNGAPSSTSQVTAIASAIANDVGMAVAPARVTMVAPRRPIMKPARPAAAIAPLTPLCRAAKGMSLSDAVAAFATCNSSDAAQQGDLLQLATIVLNGLPTPGSLKNLPATTLPRTLYITLDDFENDGTIKSTSEIQPTLQELNDLFGLTLRLECAGRSRTDNQPEAHPENVGDAQALRGVYDGIVVSASRSCRLRAKQVRSERSTLVAQTYFWAQDSRDLTVLPTSRGFLVQRSVGYTFAGGQATGVTDSRPSEALAIVSFPGTVIGSFVGGITTGATNRQAKTGARTQELKTQTDYLTAQTNYLAAQTQLQKAKTGSVAP